MLDFEKELNCISEDGALIYNSVNEINISEKIISIVQKAVNAFEVFRLEYMAFIDSDETDVDKILNCLNNVRFYKKVISLSESIIQKNDIKPNGNEIFDFFGNNFKGEIKGIQVSINEIRKKYLKIFNDSVDIEDEDEYQRIQRETRQKIKTYKAMNEFCVGLCDIIENYNPIILKPNQQIDIEQEQVTNVEPELSTKPTAEYVDKKIVNLDIPDFYKGFKPTYFTYNNQKYAINNWKKVYIKFIDILYSNINFTHILRSYIGKSVSSKTHNHPDFADKKLSEIMRVPFKIANDFFMETNFSTSDIIRKIKSIMLICNISADSFLIEYDVPMKYKEVEEENAVDKCVQVEFVIENSVPIHKKEAVLPENVRQSHENKNITLVMNNREYMIYDCTDALIKICEFLIRLEPFKMARITKFNIKLKGILVFYRSHIPVADYKKLSNGLQLMPVKSFEEVNEITGKLVDYCGIDRNMIILKDE